MVRNIIVSCGDPGSFNNVFPVGVKLEEAGVDVVWAVDGFSSKEFSDMGKSFKQVDSVDDFLSDYSCEDLIVSGFSENRRVEWQLDNIHKNKGVPVLKIQDTWTSHIFTDWSSSNLWPDYVCVNDELGSRFIRDAWPSYEGDVFITGFPNFDKHDKYSNLDLESMKYQLKNAKNINGKLVLLTGTLEHAGKLMKEVTSALITSELHRDIYFIARAHPRMKTATSDCEKELWKESLNDYEASGGLLVSDTSGSTIDWLAASDLVLSDISSTLTEAVILRNQSISVLYSEFEEYFKEGTSGRFKTLPLVELGCVAQAHSFESLVSLLKKALTDGLGLEEKQKSTFNLDGKNADRVVEKILSII